MGMYERTGNLPAAHRERAAWVAAPLSAFALPGVSTNTSLRRSSRTSHVTRVAAALTVCAHGIAAGSFVAHTKGHMRTGEEA